MKNMKRSVALLVAIALLIGCAAGGTMAWLMDKTTAVTNTFTTSDIKITLEESDDLNLKMVPGDTITKDPKVTVTADSEDCYVFVKVEKLQGIVTYTPVGGVATETTWNDWMTFDIAAGWTQVPDVQNVYYKVFDGTDPNNVKGSEYSVLLNDEVTVKTTVTKKMMNAVSDSTKPKLTFTAYAVQKSGFDTVTAAWTQAQTLDA